MQNISKLFFKTYFENLLPWTYSRDIVVWWNCDFRIASKCDSVTNLHSICEVTSTNTWSNTWRNDEWWSCTHRSCILALKKNRILGEAEADLLYTKKLGYFCKTFLVQSRAYYHYNPHRIPRTTMRQTFMKKCFIVLLRLLQIFYQHHLLNKKVYSLILLSWKAKWLEINFLADSECPQTEDL